VRHGAEPLEKRVAKTRPDDFRGEIAHIEDVVKDPSLPSPLDLETGIDTMKVIVAALESSRQGRLVRIDD